VGQAQVPATGDEELYPVIVSLLSVVPKKSGEDVILQTAQQTRAVLELREQPGSRGKENN